MMSRAGVSGMMLRVLAVLPGVLVGWIVGAGVAGAQEGATPPRWVWHPSEDSGRIPAETRVFRKVILVKEPDSRLVLEVTADNAFELYLDGKEVARGENWAVLQRVDVRLARGEHVLAAVASNEGEGPAGFLVRGGLLPLGQAQPVHTDRSWKTSAKPAAGDGWKLVGFDDAGWSAAQELGELGVAPWGTVGTGEAGSAGGFRVAEGLAVRQVAAPGVTGSAVSFTFDAEGRPVVGIERGPVARLVDEDRDGVYEGRFVIAPQMQNCQGLYFEAEGTLWAVGQGPRGTGIYHWKDGDGDGVFEAMLRYVATDGMGEHGPHAVMRGPDGSLYFNAGNHAHIKQEVDERSPVGRWFLYEGELLKHHGDPRGHAVEIRAPGGEIYRSDDDGASWHRVVGGFRNQYDFAFNRAGEIFSFDSDMEWDLGLPWYRPVRVNFCPPGAELGWRTGTAVWPVHYFDSVPAALDVGRGSPTGVTFYQARLLPAEYEDAFLFCDWSQGRILAARLEPAGAGYTGKEWELISGQPLNCTDIEVGPDGAVYFTTGGRGTLGGLYRIASKAGGEVAERMAVAGEPVLAAIVQSSPGSSYARRELAGLKERAGAAWTERLAREYALNTAIPGGSRIRALDLLHQTGEDTAEKPLDRVFLAVSRDGDALVRAKGVQILGWRNPSGCEDVLIKALEDGDAVVRRRAAEALVRIRPGRWPVEKLIGLLDEEDRWVRASARVALEHGGEGVFAGREVPQTNPRTAIEYMLAEVRVTRPAGERRDVLLGKQVTLLEGLSGLETTEATARERVDLLRLIALVLHLGGEPKVSGELAERLRVAAGKVFAGAQVNLGHSSEGFGQNAEDGTVRAEAWEAARLMAYLGGAEVVSRLQAAQELAGKLKDRVSEIHYAYCLKDVKEGWTPEARGKMWRWFERASRWEGGFSFHGYLDYMIQDLLPVYPEVERAALLERAAETPFPARVLVRGLDLEGDAGAIGRLEGLYKGLDPAVNPGAVQELKNQVIEKLGGVKGAVGESHRVLRAIAVLDAGRRDLVARAVASQPAREDFAVLVAALESRDGNTIRQVLRGLEQLDTAPAGPEGLRGLIRLAVRVQGDELEAVGRLARKWNPRVAVPGLMDGPALARFWSGVYHQKYPEGPALEETGAKPAYTLVDLVRGVVDSGAVQRGSAERGAQVIAKARCLDCHKFGNQGQGLGPELTTVSSRFRPAEILESIFEPSKVISDQYKSVTVATKDGQVLTGMPVGGDEKTMVLLLSDGTRTTLAKEDVEEQKAAQVSVMPQGLLEPLSVQEIADLLALFEAQPRVPVAAPAGGGEGGK